MDNEVNNSYSDVTKTFTTSFKKTVNDVLQKYNDLLVLLAKSIEESRDAKKISKFCEVRQDMFEFAKNHSGLFRIEKMSIKGSEKELLNIEPSNYKSAEHFLGYEKFLFFIRKNIKLWEDYEYFVISAMFLDCRIVSFIERLFRKPMSELGAENVDGLKDLWLVTDVKWKKTKCSIKDLLKNLDRRFEDFDDDIVSSERIDELSFTLDGTTSHLVTNSQCSVCIDEFEEKQVLCRMPCGHCFHKECIENWFPKENINYRYNEEENSVESSTDSLESIQNNIVDINNFRPFGYTSSSSEDEINDDLVNSTARLSINNNDLHEVTSEQDRNLDANIATPLRDSTGATTGFSESSFNDVHFYNESESFVDNLYYDFNSFDENLDLYDLPVENSEIKTKSQCPICRSYCW